MKKIILISAILAAFVPGISAKPAGEKKPGHFHKILKHKKKAAKKSVKKATGPTSPPPVDEN